MKTNQSELIGHVIKKCVNCTKTNVTEVINNLQSVVKFQYDNLKYCIHDQGDNRLNNYFSYHQFQSFSEENRKNHYKEYFVIYCI